MTRIVLSELSRICHKNKYTRAYIALMYRAATRQSNNTNVENHHILPKSIKPNDTTVALTYKEHYIAHLLLTKMLKDPKHKNKMSWALHRLSNRGGSGSKSETIVSSSQYNLARKMYIKGMSGDNHHSKRIDGWNEQMSNQVKTWWDTNPKSEARKKRAGETGAATIKQRWANDPEKMMLHQKKAAAAGKEKNATRIEYNGKQYIGWTDFTSITGVSKHSYRKYYENGIDPEFRKGKDGPMTFEDIHYLVETFAYNHNEAHPSSEKDFETILGRMRSVALISERDYDLYMKKVASKWQK